MCLPVLNPPPNSLPIYPSGFSQSAGSECPASCIELALEDVLHKSCQSVNDSPYPSGHYKRNGIGALSPQSLNKETNLSLQQAAPFTRPRLSRTRSRPPPSAPDSSPFYPKIRTHIPGCLPTLLQASLSPPLLSSHLPRAPYNFYSSPP